MNNNAQFKPVSVIAPPRDCGFEHVCFGCRAAIPCPCEVRPGRETVFITVAFCPACVIAKGFAPARGTQLQLVKP